MVGSVEEINPGAFLSDYSWNDVWKTPQELVNIGAVGVCRYHSLDASKDLGGIGPVGSEAQRDNEIEMLASVGLGDIPNWETSQTSPLGGYDAGRRHGIEFLRQMRIAGIPEGVGCPAVMSFDFDIQPSQFGIAREYMRGANESLGGFDPWAYGHDRIVTHLYEEGYIVGAWQCQAWSYGRRSPYANILQFARPPRYPDTDDNVALLKSKMWFPGKVPKPPEPKTGDIWTMGNHIAWVDVVDDNDQGSILYYGELIMRNDGVLARTNAQNDAPGVYGLPRGKSTKSAYEALPDWDPTQDAYWLADRFKERGVGGGSSSGNKVSLEGTIHS